MKSITRFLALIVAVAGWLVASPNLYAMFFNDIVARKGELVTNEAAACGLPRQVLTLVNDPLRTVGWCPVFSQHPNDVTRYAFSIQGPVDVQHLVDAFAKIDAAQLVIRLAPENGPIDPFGLDHTVHLPGIEFSMGNQKTIDVWYKQLKEVEPGVREFGAHRYREPPRALPPTLTIYAENGHVALERLIIPLSVDLETAQSWKWDEKAKQWTLPPKEIIEFVKRHRERQTNRGSIIGGRAQITGSFTTAVPLTADTALAAYERYLDRLTNIFYEVRTTYWDDSSSQQSRRYASMQEERYTCARRDGAWFFSLTEHRYWMTSGSAKEQDPLTTDYTETLMAGCWFVSSPIHVGTQTLHIAQICANVVASPILAIGGITPFLFVHGHANGSEDQFFLPSLMKHGGAMSLVRDETGERPLVVLRAQNQYGLWRLWLDPARDFAAVRLVQERGLEESRGTNTLAAVGLRSCSRVIETEDWRTFDGLALPMRVIERERSTQLDNREKVERVVAELSNVRMGTNAPAEPFLGRRPKIPDDMEIMFFDREIRNRPYPAGSDDAQLAAALAPLHNEFWPYDNPTNDLRLVAAKIAECERTFQRWESEKATNWFLRPLLPAIGGTLAQKRADVEREQARREGLAALKGKPAPDGELETLDGKKVRLSEFIAGKPAVLSFWGYTCGPCREEAPHLTALYKQYKERGLTVVAINCFKDSREKVDAYIKETGLDVPVLLGGNKLSRDYFFHSAPATFFVDRKGRVTDSLLGFSTNNLRALEDGFLRLVPSDTKKKIGKEQMH